MKIKDIEQLKEGTLSIDVPNEDWLQDKIDYARSKGRNSYGVPYMGSTTASVRGSPPRVRVMRLASLPGMRNEQTDVRRNDLKWLMDYMDTHKKLPPMGTSPDSEYLPYIMVAYNGEAWVNEGNHRIMAAYRLNWPDMPIEIRYFDGGERVRDGIMYPGKIGLGEVPTNEDLNEADTKVTDFIEAVYAKYPQTFQNNHVMPMGGTGDDQQFAMFELVPSFSRRGAVEVKWIQAYPLRQGVGSRAMQELQGMAKDAGIALTLFPWDKGQVSQAKLTKFYKSQGFKPTIKGAKNMAWTPESLDEAFDQPYPMTWEKSEADDSMGALAQLPDGSNLSIKFNMEYDEEGEEVIQVQFHRNNSQEITGDGDAQRVFATVLAAGQQYIKTHNPKRLTFSASKEVGPDQNSESRAKLYDRLVMRYARTWGYRPLRTDTGSIVRYELSRLKPVQGMAEDKQPGKPVIDAILKAMPIAQEIWFHGSRATAKHRKNSDTDILVVVPDDLVGDQYLGTVRILQKLSTHFDNHDIQPTKSGTNIHRIAQEEGRLLWSNKQGVAEGSEHEGLVLQFLKSITPKELRYYSIRDNCGPAALHMMDWAKEKGIELHRVNGYFVADNVVYDKADFTKEMKHEFLQQGLDFNDPNSRQEFIASNPKYSKEWKKVPHYWLQDDQGTVYDPTGYIQFIKTGLAKDLDKSRYETKQGVAEGSLNEFLIERATSILFHYTSIESALTIVKSGVFQLSSITGNKSEELYAPPGHPFFLSLTRTSHGDYHNYVGTGAVLLKLNGDWFNSRYIVKPIDYWERAWNGSPGRSREAEDRVFSKDPTIPDGAITEIHLLMKEQEEYRSPRARELMILSKQRGIPIFLYTDDKAWRLLDNRRAKNVADSGDVLRGSRKNVITYRKPTDYIKPWLELLEKDREEQLSPRAVKLVHNLKYYGSYHQDEDDGLGNDLSNARKPGAADRESAVKLIKYMQLHHISTVQFKNQLTKKWVAIADAKNKKQQADYRPLGVKDPLYSTAVTDSKIVKGLEEQELDEGGWASAATQNTKITPAVIGEAVGILKEFETEFNQWQANQELDVEIKIGNPVGSGTYYKRDLAQDPERLYGDVDVMCYIHGREGVGAAHRTAEYAEAVEEFTQGHSNYSTDNGTNVFMVTSAGLVQVDLIYTYHEHANWARMLAPEYRVKGVINTSLVSSVAEVLNLSIGVQGIQVKTRGGQPVNFRQGKDIKLSTVSVNPENWGADIYSYYYELEHGALPKIPANLAKHGGLKDEQRISDIVLTIKAVVTSMEREKLLGTGALSHIANKRDMIQQIARIFGAKLEKVINSSKFDKGITPMAKKNANKTKLMLAKYRNEITKLLLN